MRAKSNIILVLIVLMAIALVGCQSLLDMATPTPIPQRAADYACMPDLGGIGSLWDARLIEIELGINHRDNQLKFMRMIEDDKNSFTDAKQVIVQNMTDAGQMQRTVIEGVSGIPGVQSMLYGFGGLLLGRNFLKRPGDKSPDELKTESRAVVV